MFLATSLYSIHTVWRGKDLPTDVEIALSLQQFPDCSSTLPQEVLDVDLLGLVSGEGHLEVTEDPGVTVTLQLLLVDVVLVSVTTAKEENSLPQLLAWRGGGGGGRERRGEEEREERRT